jgi:two-component system, LytTR family, sensor histidine kinase AlgZ
MSQHLQHTRPLASTAFDVCHVGVVLRALLFVHSVLAVALMFSANTVANWFTLFATSASVALPAVLMWLLAACVGKRVWGGLAWSSQWIAAVVLGAICAVFSSIPTWMLTISLGAWPNTLFEHPFTWLAPALAGGLLAAIMFQWLRLRALATLPAETTARLAELQSRIRPHFLFNTLNTALTLVRLDPARAENVLEDLAELFRVAMSNGADSTSLGEEVLLAKRYLAIEQIRFAARLQVSWELDADAAHARVPPLLLQPLVENAVRHGIEVSDAGGVIHVHTRVKLGRAHISITNSLPKPGLDNIIKPGHGMALRNVRERLLLMHDVAAQFQAQREIQGDADVFRVQMVVPL